MGFHSFVLPQGFSDSSSDKEELVQPDDLLLSLVSQDGYTMSHALVLTWAISRQQTSTRWGCAIHPQGLPKHLFAENHAAIAHLQGKDGSVKEEEGDLLNPSTSVKKNQKAHEATWFTELI